MDRERSYGWGTDSLWTWVWGALNRVGTGAQAPLSQCLGLSTPLLSLPPPCLTLYRSPQSHQILGVALAPDLRAQLGGSA